MKIKAPNISILVGLMLSCSCLAVSPDSSAGSSTDTFLDKNARFHPVISELGLVVSQEAIASQVGADILEAGGNAIDAAVATGFALAVTLPRAGNLGGGGFMMVYLAKENKTIAIDYREMAPLSADRDMFLDSKGDVDNKKARFSAQSSGVPGTVAGLLHALEQYGTLSLSEVLKPAIKLASQGFKVNHDLSDSLRLGTKRLYQHAASKHYFYKPEGEYYLPGELFVQSDLGSTLKRISEQGSSGFYKGNTAELIVAQMQRSGGLITLDDLSSYKVVEREPVCGSYRQFSLCAMPPPSSGGIHLIQMLNILENFDLKKMGHNSATYLHHLIEAMRTAYADRSLYLGDPDFTPVPTNQLIDKAYARSLSTEINSNKSRRSKDVYPGLDKWVASQPNESEETTHYSTWDKQGNVVSNTYTLNFAYGSGITVEGAGFLLNNEMDDFSAKPGSANGYGLIGGKANAIQPKKRPLSSMTPSILFDSNNNPILATGTPGGSTIITIVMQMILNTIEFNMGIAEATAAPRIHHQWLPDTVSYENGISIDSLNILSGMGHNISPKARVLGSTQSIASKSSFLEGSADSRRQGAAALPQKK
ncbi:gamma-glutamyltransferase [bacterium]|nr:gamma-glutamyltransferase [bacterium]